MRRPSARIPVNTVTIQPVSFTQDGDGGRVVVPGTPSARVRCRVHPASSRDLPDHMREEGVEYVTIHFFEPDFAEDQDALKIRDLVHWLDFTPAKVLTVIAPPRTAAGDKSTWLVDCEYRVPPAAGRA